MRAAVVAELRRRGNVTDIAKVFAAHAPYTPNQPAMNFGGIDDPSGTDAGAHPQG